MIFIGMSSGWRHSARQTRERFAPVAEAARAFVRATLDLTLAVWRFVYPAVRCSACDLNSIVVRHTCGRRGYLRDLVKG